MQFVYAPFYALFVIGPIANLIEIGLADVPALGPLRLAPAVAHAHQEKDVREVADFSTRLEYLLGGFGWCHMPWHMIREHVRAGRQAPVGV